MSREMDDLLSPPRKKGGLRPGQRHEGQFKQGHDPRRNINGPDGPEGSAGNIRRKAKRNAQKALETAIAVMQDTKESGTVRLRAVEVVLNRAFGSVANEAVLEAREAAESMSTIPDLTLDELRKIAGRKAKSEVALDDGNSLILNGESEDAPE